MLYKYFLSVFVISQAHRRLYLENISLFFVKEVSQVPMQCLVPVSEETEVTETTYFFNQITEVWREFIGLSWKY